MNKTHITGDSRDGHSIRGCDGYFGIKISHIGGETMKKLTLLTILGLLVALMALSGGGRSS